MLAWKRVVDIKVGEGEKVGAYFGRRINRIWWWTGGGVLMRKKCQKWLPDSCLDNSVEAGAIYWDGEDCGRTRFGLGVQIKSSLLHILCGRCQGHIKSRYVLAAEYTSLHFRKVIWSTDRHLGVISLKMIFKAMRRNEIAEREREERERRLQGILTLDA